MEIKGINEEKVTLQIELFLSLQLELLCPNHSLQMFEKYLGLGYIVLIQFEDFKKQNILFFFSIILKKLESYLTVEYY